MRDGKTHLFGHVQRGQQGAFLMAGGAGVALLAGKGHKHLVLAVRAADAGEAVMQVAVVEKGPYRPLDHRAPEAVLGPKLLVVHVLEGLEMPVHQAAQAVADILPRTHRPRTSV
jgi:hypothetical protein